MERSDPILSVDDAHVFYGNIHALKGVSLAVPRGTIVALLGANGSGKTTTLRTISGLLAAKRGDIRFEEVMVRAESRIVDQQRQVGVLTNARADHFEIGVMGQVR